MLHGTTYFHITEYRVPIYKYYIEMRHQVSIRHWNNANYKKVVKSVKIQYFPVHAPRKLPISERITSDVACCQKLVNIGEM